MRPARRHSICSLADPQNMDLPRPGPDPWGEPLLADHILQNHLIIATPHPADIRLRWAGQARFQAQSANCGWFWHERLAQSGVQGAAGRAGPRVVECTCWRRKTEGNGGAGLIIGARGGRGGAGDDEPSGEDRRGVE